MKDSTQALRALMVFAVLAALHTWPLSAGLASRSLHHNADAQQWAWTLAWVAHILVRQPWHLFNGNVFAPEPAVLTYSDPVIVPALIGAPAWWMGASPALVFNVVLVSGLVLTAWAGWFVALRWTGSQGAALVAGALMAFNAHVLTRLPHTPAAHVWSLPLALYLADRLIEAPRRRDVFLLALVVASAAWTSFYTLTFVALILGVVMVVGLTRMRGVAAIAVAGLAGLLLAAPVLWPYARFASTGITRPLSMVADFAAHPSAYITSLSRLHAGWSSTFFRDEVNVLFAGVAALVLAAAGVVAGMGRERTPAVDRRRVITLAVLAAVAVLLSLGPATSVYRFLYDALAPLRGLRAVARFGYLYLMALALLAAGGVAWLERRAGLRTGRFVGAAALALVTLEAYSGPVTTVPFSSVPAIYDVVAKAPGPVLLVELPFFPAEVMFENGEYMVNATRHWRPVMNGYSGHTPDSYRRRASAFWFFPEEWAIEAIVREGATHVMVHLERFTPDERTAIEAVLLRRRDLRPIASDPAGHRLLQVVR